MLSAPTCADLLCVSLGPAHPGSFSLLGRKLEGRHGEESLHTSRAARVHFLASPLRSTPGYGSGAAWGCCLKGNLSPLPTQHHGPAASPDVTKHEQSGVGERERAAEQHGVLRRRALPPGRAPRRAGGSVVTLAGLGCCGGIPEKASLEVGAVQHSSACAARGLLTSWSQHGLQGVPQMVITGGLWRNISNPAAAQVN